MGRKKLPRFRSKFESTIAKQLADAGVEYRYESEKYHYTIPASNHIYTLDFIVKTKTGKYVQIEGKGIFDREDRAKHLLLREQHEDVMDVHFVFQNSKLKLYKGSKTTYADWCNKHGFKYSDKLIPKDWLEE